ncbi:unnamed protein product, partial [Polarella glacialis]
MVKHNAWARQARPMTLRQGGPPASEDESVSKFLSLVLRHNAVKLGLTVRPDGYVLLSEVLGLSWFEGRGVGEEEIKGLVDRNAKKRFGLCIPEGEEELHIRAHQGHTICNVEDASLLREVTDATELPVLCHGTFSHLWPKIQTEGLRAMKRNHIHCVAVDLADPVNQGRVLSGTRGESDVIVYI